jgi:signal transduction histidine kinase
MINPSAKRRQRAERRFAVDQDGVLALRGEPANGIAVRIKDVSSSGMQLQSPCAVPLGARIQVQWSGLQIDGMVCYAMGIGDRFQLGVELFGSGERLVSEVLARQAEQLADAKQELERRNRELASALEAAHHAASVKGRFLASVSHELRTPLNGIIGFTQLLFDRKLGDMAEPQRGCLAEVLGCSRHLLSLVSDLLDMSRIEAGRFEFRPEWVRVAQLARDAVDELRPLMAEKGLHVELQSCLAPDEVLTDPTRLRQILYNYLSNAVKFTPRNGRITVRLSSEGEDAYRIEVEDSGPGIKESDVPRLFCEFEQLENCGSGGAGLGLALTKRMVEAQGGAVGVRSRWGSGSTFFMVLPLIQPAGAIPSAPGS